MGLANQTALRWTSKSATPSRTIFSKTSKAELKDLVGGGREHEIPGNVKLRQTCGTTDFSREAKAQGKQRRRLGKVDDDLQLRPNLDRLINCMLDLRNLRRRMERQGFS